MGVTDAELVMRRGTTPVSGPVQDHVDLTDAVD